MSGPEGRSTEMSVTFLGTAAARFTPGVNTASLLVRVGPERLLVDCGVGTVRQIHRAGCSVQELSAVFLTHWHPDHVAGLPRLIRHAGARARTMPLRIYAPAAPLSARCLLWLMAARQLPYVRIGHPEPVTFDHVQVSPVPADHGPLAHAWVFEERHGGRRVVVSGDTRPTATVAAAAHRCDVLVHEATYLARDHQRANARGHSTALDAARVASAAGVSALALTHLGMAAPRPAALAEARTMFGAVFVPHDLDRLDVGPPVTVQSLYPQ